MADLSAVVGFVGFCRGMGAIHRKWRREYRIWCSGGAEGMVGGVRTGRNEGPSDVAEEWMRPCRARWGHDLSMGRTLEKLGAQR